MRRGRRRSGGRAWSPHDEEVCFDARRHGAVLARPPDAGRGAGADRRRASSPSRGRCRLPGAALMVGRGGGLSRGRSGAGSGRIVVVTTDRSALVDGTLRRRSSTGAPPMQRREPGARAEPARAAARLRDARRRVRCEIDHVPATRDAGAVSASSSGSPSVTPTARATVPGLPAPRDARRSSQPRAKRCDGSSTECAASRPLPVGRSAASVGRVRQRAEPAPAGGHLPRHHARSRAHSRSVPGPTTSAGSSCAVFAAAKSDRHRLGAAHAFVPDDVRHYHLASSRPSAGGLSDGMHGA